MADLLKDTIKIFGIYFKLLHVHLQWLTCPNITKTCLVKYIENFTTKKEKFSDNKNSDILLKTQIVGTR